MHLVDALDLPDGYAARPYRGVDDLPQMLDALIEYRTLHRDDELPTLDQMRHSYSRLTDCDPEADIALLHTDDGAPVGYCRAYHEDLATGVRDCVVFAPIRAEHLARELATAIVRGVEQHMAERAEAAGAARYRAFCSHPGPGLEPVGEAAWLEELGYVPTEWEASLLRPDLDDIPDLPLRRSGGAAGRAGRGAPRVGGQLRGVPRRVGLPRAARHRDRPDGGRSPAPGHVAVEGGVGRRRDRRPGQAVHQRRGERTRSAGIAVGTPSSSRPTTSGATGASPARCWR